MLFSRVSLYAPLLFVLGHEIAWSQTHALTEVFHDDHFQLTGVSVSKSGRLFVNYPRWSDSYRYAVVEVGKDGSAKPFPDQDWNVWDSKPASAGKHFVCVQSVVVDDSDTLWVLDPAAPLLASVVPGGAKLVGIDLKTNRVTRVINFGSDVVKPDSYLNDIRFDLPRHTAYMTDSGPGGIVVLDLTTGKAHRALDNTPATKFEKSVQIVIDGKPVLGPDKKPPAFNSDGIALSPDGNYLYFQAVTAKTLYRVKTSALRDNPAGADSSVEKVAQTFPVDGLWMDKKSRIYLSDLTHDAVSRLMPDGKIETLVTDKRLQWPDTFSEGPDGSIYITASHIHDSPKFNDGLSVRKLPYTVFKLNP
jgi:sugar lactone lactonase YvrE